MVDCRSSWAFPTPSGSSVLCPGLRPRDFYSRLLYRRLSAFRFHRVAPVSSSVSGTCVPFTSRSFRLTPSEPRSSAAEAASDPDLSKPRLLRSFRPSFSVNWIPVWRPAEACASWRLSQGIAFPFRVALHWYDRQLQSPVGATCSVPFEHFTVIRYPPLCLPAGRPSGRWVSSNGVLKLLP